MNYCKFASMLAYITFSISQFFQKIEKISRFVLNRLVLNPNSGLVFLRSIVVVLIVVVAWVGVGIQPIDEIHHDIKSTPTIVAVTLGGEVWADVPPSELDTASQALRNAPASSSSTTPVNAINAIINVMYALLTPFLMLAGWLLTPDWVFGEIFGLRPVLHDLWILISNIVYVVFAFLLVAMAFMNIFGKEGNTWAIRAKLPKLIIGVVSVPFTWLFVSAVVSFTSILTASAVQLAGDLAPTDVAQMKFPMPGSCTLDFTQNANGSATGSKFLDCEKSTEDKPFSELFTSDNAFGIVSYYAYGVFQIQEYKNITALNLGSIKDALNLSVQLLIALVMFIGFFLIIVALVFALLSRALYFWAISVFSPLLSLRYFFEGKLGGFGDKWLTITNIIGLAMVPVYVAAALSFGLIFTSAVTTKEFKGTTTSNYVQDIGPGVPPNSQVMTIFGTTYTVIGVPVGTTLGGDLKQLGGGFIGKLLIQLAALGVLWFAVMAALKGSDVTKEAAAPIASFGEDIGKLMQSLPKYAPIIPTGHGMASMAGLKGISNTVQGAVAGIAQTRGNEVGASINRALGISSPESDKIVKAINKINIRNDLSGSTKDNMRLLKDGVAEVGLTSDKAGEKQYQNVLTAIVNKANIPDSKQKQSLLDEIQHLTNDPTTMDKFLKNYSHIAGGNDIEMDTARELNEYIKSANSSTTNTISTSSSPAKITINVSPTVSSNIPMQLDTEGKTLTQNTITALQSALTEATRVAPTPQAKIDKTHHIAEEIKTWLNSNNISPADQKTILNSIDPSLNK